MMETDLTCFVKAVAKDAGTQAVKTPGSLVLPYQTKTLCSGRRGVVLILVLIGLILLAALVAYVFNVGQQTQRKTQTQMAADAVAVSGPGYLARGLNTIAMNNVAMANMIGLINNLDAMPRTIKNTRLDQEALLESLTAQLNRGVTGIDGTQTTLLRNQLLSLQSDVTTEVDQLVELDQLFDGYDVSRITHWSSNYGRGEAWRAMAALDAYSEATAESLGELAQVAAVQTAEGNLHPSSPGATGVMLPVVADLPIVRGSWADLEDPSLYGQTPAGVRHAEFRRGPWDTLFGWRDGYYYVELVRQTLSGGGVGNGSGGSGWSGRGDTIGSQWIVTSHELLEYATFGAHHAIQRHLSGTGDDLVLLENNGNTATGLLYYRMRSPLSGIQRTPDLEVGDSVPDGGWGRLRSILYWSRVNRWHRDLVSTKASMTWGGVLDDSINEPQWTTNRVTALAMAEADPDSVVETCYVRVVMRSVYENGRLITGPVISDTDVFWRRGFWRTPAGLDESDMTSQYIFHDEVRDTETIEQENGTEIERETVYDNYFVWIGINTGEDVAIENPYEGLTADVAPAPMDFDDESWALNAEGLHDDLAFLSVVTRQSDAVMMPGRFDRQHPVTDQVAFSQSRVFNNHSDDLWTQMWRVQLEPVRDYENWVDLMETSRAEAATIPVVDLEAVDQMLGVMQASESAVESMGRH